MRLPLPYSNIAGSDEPVGTLWARRAMYELHLRWELSRGLVQGDKERELGSRIPR
jgi:hypothetical protein